MQQRIFIGLPVEIDKMPQLKLLRQKLRRNSGRYGRDIRFIADRNLHITLAFIGEVDPSGLAQVTEVMQSVATQDSFTLCSQGLEAIPSAAHTRTLWLRFQQVDGLSTLLDDLWQKLQAITSLDWQPDSRAFIPHLTLARLPRPQNTGKLVSPFEKLAPEKLQCQRIVLYSSDLQPGGAEYSELLSVELSR